MNGSPNKGVHCWKVSRSTFQSNPLKAVLTPSPIRSKSHTTQYLNTLIFQYQSIFSLLIEAYKYTDLIQHVWTTNWKMFRKIKMKPLFSRQDWEFFELAELVGSYLFSFSVLKRGRTIKKPPSILNWMWVKVKRELVISESKENG